MTIEAAKAVIKNFLDHYFFDDAIFLAECLFAEVRSDEALYLLATCYYRCGQTMSAYLLLNKHGALGPNAELLLARCCLDLKKQSEAEELLVRHTGTGTNLGGGGPSIADSAISFNPSLTKLLPSFGQALLGNLHSKSKREKEAILAYSTSLKQNPFLWSSFCGAISLGENLEPKTVFQRKGNDACVVPEQGESVPVIKSSDDSLSAVADISKFALARKAPAVRSPLDVLAWDSFSRDSVDALGSFSREPFLSTLTPSIHFGLSSAASELVTSTPLQVPAISTPDVPIAQASEVPKLLPKAPRKLPTRRGGPHSSGPPTEEQHVPPPAVVSHVITRNQAHQQQQQVAAQVLRQNQTLGGPRRSNRLQKENTVGQGIIGLSRDSSGGKAPALRKNDRRKPSISEMNRRNLGQELMSGGQHTPDILKENAKDACTSTQGDGLFGFSSDDKSLVFGEIELAMSRYDCSKVIDLCDQTLSDKQIDMGWVYSILARAHFEMGNTDKTIELFKQCRLQAPHYLKGMEFYSSALWQQQREVELSALAQELTEQHHMAPESWIAAGNCFSLQKDHEAAIKFFKRAMQISPDFVGAYTLLGHEYIALEEFEQAMQCFQSALRVRPRYYNAFYGIGTIYHKQQKLKLAEYFYRQALTINPRNALLMCHISVVQQALQQPDQALQLLDQALSLSPRNPLCRYHKAALLFAQDQPTDALSELNELKQIVPKESQVYFLAGKVYKKLNQQHFALMNFTWATDLDPRGGSCHASGGDRYDEEPITALATMDSDDLQPTLPGAQDSDQSY